MDGNVGDRKNLTAWHQGDKLILAVAAQNNNTIVVVNSVGPLIIEPWADHPNVTAVSSPPPIITSMSNLGLDRVGKPWGERSRKCDRGYIVWSLESFWASSIHDCEEIERLPGTTCSRGYGDGHPVHQLYRRVGFSRYISLIYTMIRMDVGCSSIIAGSMR